MITARKGTEFGLQANRIFKDERGNVKEEKVDRSSRKVAQFCTQSSGFLFPFSSFQVSLPQNDFCLYEIQE
jgi:hypothetical protein